MLTLTRNAVRAVTEVVAADPTVSDTGGVRLYATQNQEGEAAIHLAVEETPDAGDQVIEQAGAQIFVEQAIVDYLNDKTLDAVADAEGVHFSIKSS